MGHFGHLDTMQPLYYIILLLLYTWRFLSKEFKRRVCSVVRKNRPIFFYSSKRYFILYIKARDASFAKPQTLLCADIQKK